MSFTNMPKVLPPNTEFWDVESRPYAYIPAEGWFNCGGNVWSVRGSEMPPEIMWHGLQISEREFWELIEDDCNRSEDESFGRTRNPIAWIERTYSRWHNRRASAKRIKERLKRLG